MYLLEDYVVCHTPSDTDVALTKPGGEQIKCNGAVGGSLKQMWMGQLVTQQYH